MGINQTILESAREIFKAIISDGGYSSKDAKRYVFASRKNEQVIPMNNLSVQIIYNYIFAAKLKSGEFIGAWVHNDCAFLDVCTSSDSKMVAIEQCKKLNEIAFYDTEESKEVFLENLDTEERPFNQQFFNDIAAQFDTHVRQSIPMFDSVLQHIKNMIITNGGEKSTVLDLCGSTGKLGELLQFDNWNGEYSCLDGSPQMNEVFCKKFGANNPNLKYILAGFGSGWVEPDGTVIPEFKPTKKYDFVVESLGFQFFTKTRDKEVKEVAKLSDNFITFEKFRGGNEVEELKDKLHKSKFFSPKEIEEKRENVLIKMGEYLTDSDTYLETLKANYKYVYEFARIGNFKGYYATNIEQNYLNPNNFVDRLVNNKFNI